MRSLTTWFREVLGQLYLLGVKRVGKASEIELQLRRTDRRFLDAQALEALAGISRDDAERMLREAASAGELVRRFIFSSAGYPVVYLSKDYVGKTVRLSDLGYVGDDEEQEVYINPNDVREVFIEPGVA